MSLITLHSFLPVSTKKLCNYPIMHPSVASMSSTTTHCQVAIEANRVTNISFQLFPKGHSLSTLTIDGTQETSEARCLIPSSRDPVLIDVPVLGPALV